MRKLNNQRQTKDLTDLEQAQRENLLRGSWMYHDYMWFQQTIELLGPVSANAINQHCIFEIGKAEMTRLMRQLRLYPVRCIEDVVKLILAANELYIGSFVQMSLENGTDWLVFKAEACLPQKGTSRDGLGKYYHCGALKRITGWLSAIGVDYVVEPTIGLCLVSQGQECAFTVRLQASWLESSEAISA
jgi:hypothetical protein